MTDRPMVFSALMVRAMLDGSKTQERRILKNQQTWDRVGESILRQYPEQKSDVPFAVGDKIWVREVWGHDASTLDDCRRGVESDGPKYGPYYMADANWFDNASVIKRSPNYMPRWASRITLTVTKVRVQRLQDISEEDARAEGVEPTTCANVLAPEDGFPSYRSAYAWIVWETIHGKGSWALNPWVCALTFKVAKVNINALQK